MGQDEHKLGVGSMENLQNKNITRNYFDFQNLVFEGEYLNGEINGKGKEYHLNDIIFEGEYFKGKKNGNGKEYNFNQIKFEGEYLNSFVILNFI